MPATSAAARSRGRARRGPRAAPAARTVLGGVEEMSFINDEDDAAVPLGGLGGEQVAGLGHQLGFEVAGVSGHAVCTCSGGVACARSGMAW
jgi:hypothetical protein